MYKRSKKDDYRKRIEEMIGGSQKCSRESSANSNNIDNYNTNISNDTTSVMDCSINDSNDVVTSSDINDSSIYGGVITPDNSPIRHYGGVIYYTNTNPDMPCRNELRRRNAEL